mmetsp:Transcript_12480/g.28219  ORF Transcript_12480/g.28219 Transcript_12480/m.28219 type:complete len:205 (+) Transcript_12480:71-685(+)
MSLREVREIFDQQVERAIVKLHQARRAQSRRGKGALEDDDVSRLRDIAEKMTDSIMHKLVDNAPAWNLEFQDIQSKQDMPDHSVMNVEHMQSVADPQEEERIMKEIVATRERLAARLDATKQLVCELQESRKKLDAVQSQQARGPTAVEQKLQTCPFGGAWDAEEMELLEKISKAENLSKRMRSDHLFVPDAELQDTSMAMDVA